MTDHWGEDCEREYGRRLTGDYAHWCPEWDDLPIDETCREFFACSCFGKDPRAVALSNDWNDVIEEARHDAAVLEYLSATDFDKLPF